MSATKESAYNNVTGEYEFSIHDDSDFEYEKSIGLGICIGISDGWMWFTGFKFGVPIVSDSVDDSVKVAPEHLEELCEHLKDAGYSVSIMLRK